LTGHAEVTGLWRAVLLEETKHNFSITL